MAGQHFCPDNSGYAEKRVQSYDFFSYLANFQWVSSLFPLLFLFSLLKKRFFSPFSSFSPIYFVSLHPEIRIL